MSRISIDPSLVGFYVSGDEIFDVKKTRINNDWLRGTDVSK